MNAASLFGYAAMAAEAVQRPMRREMRCHMMQAALPMPYAERDALLRRLAP